MISDITSKGKKMFYRNFLLFVSFMMIMLGTALFAEAPLINDYQTLVAKVKNGDTNIDFKALRISYTKTPAYNPYREDENTPLMFEALHAKEFSKAVEYAQLILEKNYVDIDAHYVSRAAYGEMGNKDRSAFHHKVAMGLIDSIASGNGSSPEEALQVINTREEYIMLSVAGLELQQQKLQQYNDKNYDVAEVISRKNGETFILYFDVTIPFEWLNQSFQNKK